MRSSQPPKILGRPISQSDGRRPGIVSTRSVVDALALEILLKIAFLQIKTAGPRLGVVAARNLAMTGAVAFLGTQESPVGSTLKSNIGDGYNGQVVENTCSSSRLSIQIASVFDALKSTLAIGHEVQLI